MWVGELRWGEEFVFMFLKSKYKGYKCRWVNRLKESGKPYDLILTLRGRAELWSGCHDGEDQGGLNHDCSDEEEHDVYVEVKATTCGPEDADNPFPISLPELLFATDKKERFQLFRVFRAGTNTATVLAVSDFYRRLTQASQLYCQVSITATAGKGD
jgi:hypothetical protein